ncbi:hypothetical protein N7468_010194 [Penicillium chermesinum]|uniref:BZIP domain-containing protein n=1 Tax=Penicillium chermesinum TaxID=63820 RepID=A0A9W9NC83_9EURO|nr:uncharacterized protein N7468_010194 [Penicillium chermesinum]KAJ5217186.1 hypothetical protein N7468_010194 [Penicillium chermesinum]KAJ6171198.1 hypothetical protein N7470_000265 [Penicillium chermesinum]
MASRSPSSFSDSTSTTQSDVDSLLSAEFYTGRTSRPCTQNNIMFPYAGYYQWPAAPKQMHAHPHIMQPSPQHSPIGINDSLHEQHFDSSMMNPQANAELLALLSSSSYPLQESMYREMPHDFEPIETQKWGGYTIEPQHPARTQFTPAQSRSSAEQEEPAQSKSKSSRKSDASSTVSQTKSQKKRGRPRMAVDGVLDDQPEERRRAQIRIAQRAYRYRARETLVKNKARVEKLEDTIKQMEQTILQFGEQLKGSGVYRDGNLQSDLRKMTETCQALAADALSQAPQDPEPISPEAE